MQALTMKWTSLKSIKWMILLLVVMALAALPQMVSANSLTLSFTFEGKGGYSADGLGQNGTGGFVQAEITPGSTVVKAFLYGTYFGTTNPSLAQRTIVVDSTTVVTTKIAQVSTSLSTTRADVTSLVAAKVGSPSAGGIFNFQINSDPSGLDGVALVVIFENSALPESTIAVLDGGASQTGDIATFNLAVPLDKTTPNFKAIMSLGSGFSFQGAPGHGCGGGQFSIVDVNNQRLTSCAGNFDDGLGNNGALITVGGVGDDILNPPFPNQSSGGLTNPDDELYNLDPFLKQGDTQIVVKTSNPSQDDNLFLTVIHISAKAVVSVGQSLTLSPKTDTNAVNTQHCVIATVKDANGNPVSGVTVRFSVSGANSVSGSAITNVGGQAQFCYTGANAGTDAINAYADTNNNNVQDLGEPSDIAAKTWTSAAPATVALEPTADTNTAGTEHCVTATVKDASGNPVSGVTVRFSVSGANSASGSATTNASGQTQFCYTGKIVGQDTINAYADANNNNVQDSNEPFAVATKTWGPAAPAALALSPKAAANPVDSKHCVTATVKDLFGNPTPNVTVRFSVTGSVNTSGSAVTDANGEATFCYTGPALPGSDVIQAYADTNKSNVQDVGEPFDAATKTWTLPPSAVFCDATVTEGGRIIAQNGDKATFGGNAKVEAPASPTGSQEYQDHGPAQLMNVKSIDVLALTCGETSGGKQASIFGEATIDGSGVFVYRIDVQDLGEPGTKTTDTYRIRLTDPTLYDSGEQPLQGGNVQIHKTP